MGAEGGEGGKREGEGVRGGVTRVRGRGCSAVVVVLVVIALLVPVYKEGIDFQMCRLCLEVQTTMMMTGITRTMMSGAEGR